MTVYQYPSKAEIEDLFEVDIDLGTLIWMKPPKQHPRMLGLNAGSSRPNSRGKSYVRVKINGVAYLRSHLIYICANGSDCEMIDHINGDSMDDRICNLRSASVTENAWNHRGRKKKAALPMGVRSTAAGRFQARIAVNKSMIHLGTYETPELAHSIYQEKRKEYYGAFA